MSTRITKVSVKVLAVGAVTTMAFVGAPAAFAVDSTEAVEQQVNGGSLLADTTVADLAPVITSHTASTSDATLTLHVDDTTGTAAGWTVTQQVGAFTRVGGGPSIGAENFSIESIGGLVDQTNPNVDTSMVAPGTPANLSAPRTVFTADAGEGVGNYLSSIDAKLTIPADTLAGTYTAILTTTVTPGASTL